MPRVAPVSRNWGSDRGTPVDRYYMEALLADHRGAGSWPRGASSSSTLGRYGLIGTWRWAFLMISILLFGRVQPVCLGILGEYFRRTDRGPQAASALSGSPGLWRGSRGEPPDPVRATGVACSSALRYRDRPRRRATQHPPTLLSSCWYCIIMHGHEANR